MKKILNLFTATLVCLLLNQTNILASSHREAPLITADPLADNTDVYAFRSPVDTNNVVLIANFIPFELPQGGPNYYNFGTGIRYEIHVDNNANTTFDDIIYRFTFQQINQDTTTFFNIRLGQQNLKTTYTLEKSTNGGNSFVPIITGGVVPPNNIGPRSIENATLGLNVPNYDTLMNRSITTATTKEKVFAGPIDDPFFVDLGGAFDVGGFRIPGRDGLAKYNVHSLVIEVPIDSLQQGRKKTTAATSILDPTFVIGVYASASRQAVSTLDVAGGAGTATGAWIQVSRLGMPLTNEAVIPIGQKDRWNGAAPNDSAGFNQFFKNPELALYMDTSKFAKAVPGLDSLRIQQKSLGSYDFRNGKKGLFGVRNNTALTTGTAFAESPAGFGGFLLPDSLSPRAVDLLPIFLTGVPNLRPYQLATGKAGGDPLAAGKPFINNFLPTFGDYLRLNMAVPVTPRIVNNLPNPDFSSLGLVQAAVLGLTDARYTASGTALQMIPNMDGFPNGRRLEDDVTTIELQAVGGVVLAAIGLWYDDYIPGTSTSPVTPKLLSTLRFHAGVTKNDTTFKTSFPYVQAPWRGYTGAQYAGPTSVQNPLPITLLSFTAEKSGQQVLLRWKVSNEISNDRYEVEQSLDGINYTKVGILTATGRSSNDYQLLHTAPSLTKANYYRLKQIDKDGRFTYSPIRLVKFTSNSIISIMPNPAKDFIKVYSSETGMNVSIYDANGKKLASKIATDGNTEFNISRFAKGTYIVVAENNGARIETRTIVKQ